MDEIYDFYNNGAEIGRLERGLGIVEFHRTKPAIIDDNHARTAVALGYVRYAENIISSIRDDIFKISNL